MQKIDRKQNQILNNKRESAGLKYFNDRKAFIEYSNDMQHVYINIEEYNIGKKRKILILFDDMITDMVNNKKLNSIVTELLIGGRKLNISVVFITQSYLISRKCQTKFYPLFYHENPKQKTTSTDCIKSLSDIDFKNFIKNYKKCTAEPYSCLVNNTTLPSDNSFRFRKNVLK